MKRTLFLSFLILCLVTISFAQDKHTISGYVKDKASGEVLVGSTVIVKSTSTGAYTNEYGFYSLTIPAGEYTLAVRYLGYLTQEITLNLTESKRINIELQSEQMQTEEVIITAEKEDENISSTEMGTVDLDIEQIKKIPALLGEIDVLKVIQLLPGVQAAGEGQSGLYIRGGGADQNLMLLDEAVVYNTGHLFGFFSVFNPDAVSNVKLIKGGMPASYGGRLSSVVDITMKEGNNKDYHVTGGIGLISSRLTVEGPIVKDKSSFLVSARRTYADVIAQPFLREDFKGNRYYFYDINAKANYIISDKDRLFVSGYFGRDVFSFTNDRNTFSARIPWGNATTTIRWNHLFNDKLFMNLTALYNDYRFEFGASFREANFSLSSRIRDANAKIDFDYFLNPKHKLEFGAIYTYHIFDPNTLQASDGNLTLDQTGQTRRRAQEAAVYFLDEFDIGERIKINAGIRLSGFQQVGPYNRVIYDDLENAVDTVVYNRFQSVRNYGGIEPRISARFQIDGQSSIKASATMNTQYLHLVSSGSGLPSDVWVPSSFDVKPQRGTQYAIGYFRNFADNMFETSVEVYYRTMKNLVEYGENYTFDLQKEYERNFVYGTGEAYGAEFFVQKRKGDFTGWLGYTLAYTNRTFPDLNNGQTFPAVYDRRHDASIVLVWSPEKITIGKKEKQFSLAGTFIYGTGSALNLPSSYYIGNVLENPSLVNIYGDRNSYRMADYHRADISFTIHGNPAKRFQSEWVISAYNLYNRRNPYFVYLDYDAEPLSGDLEVKAYQVSVFPIIPSFTWNFKY